MKIQFNCKLKTTIDLVVPLTTWIWNTVNSRLFPASFSVIQNSLSLFCFFGDFNAHSKLKSFFSSLLFLFEIPMWWNLKLAQIEKILSKRGLKKSKEIKREKQPMQWEREREKNSIKNYLHCATRTPRPRKWQSQTQREFFPEFKTNLKQIFWFLNLKYSP